MKSKIFFALSLLLFGISFMSAQQSCYEQYLRAHNMPLPTDSMVIDDSYDELKKEVIARQLIRNEHTSTVQPIRQPIFLAIDTLAGTCHLLAQDGTILADVHLAMVDSTWYMWLSMDPLADKYPGSTPYLYCNGNPIMFIDPDGRAAYYTAAGDFLGSDNDGFSGQIFVTDVETYESVKNQSNVKESDKIIGLQNAELTADAYSKVYTHILDKSVVKGSVSKLLNNSVSVYNGQDTYNSPRKNWENGGEMASTKCFNGKIRVSVNQLSKYVYLLSTIENIQNALGDHELFAHGVRGVEGIDKHFIAYVYQVNAKSWENTTLDYKKIMLQQFRRTLIDAGLFGGNNPSYTLYYREYFKYCR